MLVKTSRSPRYQNKPQANGYLTNTQIFKQIVNLTKQNQFLKSQVQSLKNQLDKIAISKNKYKNKYIKLKNFANVKKNGHGQVNQYMWKQPDSKKNQPISFRRQNSGKIYRQSNNADKILSYSPINKNESNYDVPSTRSDLNLNFNRVSSSGKQINKFNEINKHYQENPYNILDNVSNINNSHSRSRSQPHNQHKHKNLNNKSSQSQIKQRVKSIQYIHNMEMQQDRAEPSDRNQQNIQNINRAIEQITKMMVSIQGVDNQLQRQIQIQSNMQRQKRQKYYNQIVGARTEQIYEKLNQVMIQIMENFGQVLHDIKLKVQPKTNTQAGADNIESNSRNNKNRSNNRNKYKDSYEQYMLLSENKDVNQLINISEVSNKSRSKNISKINKNNNNKSNEQQNPYSYINKTDQQNSFPIQNKAKNVKQAEKQKIQKNHKSLNTVRNVRQTHRQRQRQRSSDKFNERAQDKQQHNFNQNQQQIQGENEDQEKKQSRYGHYKCESWQILNQIGMQLKNWKFTYPQSLLIEEEHQNNVAYT